MSEAFFEAKERCFQVPIGDRSETYGYGQPDGCAQQRCRKAMWKDEVACERQAD